MKLTQLNNNQVKFGLVIVCVKYNNYHDYNF